MVDFFREKVCVVTGSARGIGKAIALAAARRGAKVVISDVLEQPLGETGRELEAAGAEVLSWPADITDSEACVALIQATIARFGRVDMLINNAGISIVANFEDCQPAACRKLIDVNLLGSIYMSLAALEALKRRRGHLIFVSSVSGVRAIPGGAVYSASKAALRSLAESLRLELRPAGVHVGVVSPGFTPTDASKTVMRGDGSARSIDRPAHDTPDGVARQTLRLIESRQRERILTPLGRATSLLQRLSPKLVDRLLAGRELKN